MIVYVIQSKNEININVGVKVKNYMIEILAKRIIYGVLAGVIVRVIRHVKLTSI